MYPPEFGYFIPASLTEALDFLDREDARPLAGGQSLIPMLKMRIISPKYLVDINRLVEISYIRDEVDKIRIGAITRYYDALKNSSVQSKLPLLYSALRKIADMQVRNLGTFGGSVSHADPASDLPTVLLAYDAKIRVTSLSEERVVEAKNFFKGPFTTDLRRGELVKEIEIPVLSGYKMDYIKVVRRAGDYALVGLACAVKLKDGYIEDIRLGYAAVDSKPYRPYEVEKKVIGNKLTPELIDEIAEKAASGANPPSDVRGSSWYRREVMKIITKKALRGVL
ncbi:MAG: glyceraldehyde dehydrogenase subunit beta [Sulfolobaceae archaeon]